MSYVSISTSVLDRIVQAARETRTEIIGFLLGKLEADTIIIEDSTTHEFASEPHRVTMPPSSIAIIADQLLSGQLKGSIVGWYHSHTEGGLFFSDIDIATQKRLQQFSSLITGIVVDSTNGEVGYFRVVPGTNDAIRLPDKNIRVYNEAEPASLRQSPKSEAAVATPTVEIRRKRATGVPTRRTIMVLVFLVLVGSIGTVAGILYSYRVNSPAIHTITLSPVYQAVIGTPVKVSANVTPGTHNVTLVYAVAASTRQALMNSVVSGEYSYTIPGAQVTGNIAYYVKAYDSAGKLFNSTESHIAVADFNVEPRSSAFTIYRTKSAMLTIQLQSINSFDQILQLSTSGGPNGLTVSYSSNPTTANNSVVLYFTASSITPNGTYPMTISATYTPSQSPQVSRETVVKVTVADFLASITPSSETVSPGSTATFTITLTLQKGFIDPVTIASISGLPKGSTFTVGSNNFTLLAGGPGTAVFTLQIKIPTSAEMGTYPIVLVISGGGVIHTYPTQIIVR